MITAHNLTACSRLQYHYACTRAHTSHMSHFHSSHVVQAFGFILCVHKQKYILWRGILTRSTHCRVPDGSMEIGLYRFDVLQSGATAQGSLKVNCKARVDQGDRSKVRTYNSPAGLATRSEQTAETSSRRLRRSGAMRGSEEGRSCCCFQDTANRATGVSRDVGKGTSNTT